MYDVRIRECETTAASDAQQTSRSLARPITNYLALMHYRQKIGRSSIATRAPVETS